MWGANPPVQYFCNLYLSVIFLLSSIGMSVHIFLSSFDMSVIISSLCVLGNLWLGQEEWIMVVVVQRQASPRQSTEEAILWGAAVASINNQTSGFQEVFFTHSFFYFEWPAWQDVIREHDDVLKFFYLTEKWNMRPPPAGELLALPSEAWNAVHKEFQKIFKTQRKNDKCSGSSREDRPTRRWKKELLLGGLRVR